ncbi:sugar transferase [Alienimonas californiensis]|uniref:UDP-N-acetylgalactosamine-undecaprenyl-phosphate N-acetylgalactosaminephosphotransferase n=1 Tax=Alienimonas californiensis TaxID=2527989 RepID=A0A517P437_9PLAN|nr:sugar transferase [Alienimonas californiensis]QDT14131.1 UDP-N-acetylgalactosamine-undecaprenyl-phosphate N-acetylgalactosaminephosphotransferase [Alienimonas californiensis]
MFIASSAPQWSDPASPSSETARPAPSRPVPPPPAEAAAASVPQSFAAPIAVAVGTVAVESLSREAFRALVEVERMRSDRSGRSLSVVTLRAPAGDARAAMATAWASRVRTTDRVVWLNRDRLALILWDTDADAARRFLRSAGHAADVPGNRGGTVLYSHPLPVPALEPGADPADGGHDSVLPVEALLVRPMPFWKRSLDVVGALVGLTVLSPALLAVYAAVRLTSPGPALFVQRRAGLGGRVFHLYKFRSMTVDAEARQAAMLTQNEQDGPAFKMEQDPRITAVGRLIRKTSVDELPQLWNVLKGEMSLVGPRPLPIAEADACRPWQRRRLTVTPGLTCGWQVQDRRMAVPFEEWVRMDLRYARRRTVRGDLSLIARTVAAVAREVRPNKPR